MKKAIALCFLRLDTVSFSTLTENIFFMILQINKILYRLVVCVCFKQKAVKISNTLHLNPFNKIDVFSQDKKTLTTWKELNVTKIKDKR